MEGDGQVGSAALGDWGETVGTVLKLLLTERHLSSHSEFCAAYDRVGAQLDPPLPPGNGPSKAQYYNWLAGSLKGLPLNHHRRVLAKMFPGWSMEALFGTGDLPQSSLTPTVPRDSPQDRSLAALLGAEMARTGVTLVVPTFELSDESVDALARAGILPQHIFSKQTSAFSGQRRIDVPVALAESDVRGMLYVMGMLQRHTDIAVDIQSDKEVVAACDRPFISFGLTSNDCTHMYLETCESPLFTIRDSRDSRRPFREDIILADGHQFTSDDSRNVGLIARVRPAPHVHPDRFWFFCAGLGPRGTTGAGWYLANYWTTLPNAASDEEFVAVVSVRTYSDQTASLEYVLTT
ncbi:hypothetical protein [Nocardia sp. NPDC051833]|uniref:hypothetical protein n=1 Tax=Nocardia sp. NPDC051833 TaxID=3155674 RepID=UPI003418432A